MRGGDLRCECGAGLVDVADVEIPDRMALMWHCANGHELITGWRPISGTHEQMRFAARSAPRSLIPAAPEVPAK